MDRVVCPSSAGWLSSRSHARSRGPDLQHDHHDHPDHQPVRVVTLVRPVTSPVFIKHMVLDTASMTVETTVESQLFSDGQRGGFLNRSGWVPPPDADVRPVAPDVGRCANFGTIGSSASCSWRQTGNLC